MVDEQAIARALEGYNSGRYETLAEAARNEEIPRKTLSDRYHREAGLPDYQDDGLDGEISSSEIPVFVREYDTAEHFVYPLGDVHKGAQAHQKAKWRSWLAYLERAENVSMLGTGDFLNVGIKESKSEVYDETMTVGDAKREMADELESLAALDRLDLLIPGNHEERVYRAVGECPVKDIAWHLDVNYSRTVAVLIYRIGDVEYTGFVLHGKGGGQVGARANRLKKQAQAIRTDFYVSGHTHSQLVFPDEYFDVDVANRQVLRRKQVFISSGSFLGMEDYAAVSGFSPTHIGAPRIRLDGRVKDVRVSI